MIRPSMAMTNVQRDANPLAVRTPYARAIARSGSLRIGNGNPSASANSAFNAGVSQLAPKHWTFALASAAPYVASERHSAVHPLVNAFGNHAITIGLRPRKSVRRYVAPSDACATNSGARSPTRNTTVLAEARPRATLVTPVAIARAVSARIRNFIVRSAGTSASVVVILL